jgi:transcriptional regulator PpsR
MSQPPPDLADLSPLSGLAPELASTFVRVAGDIALVVDDDGVIRNVAEGALPVCGSAAEWVGRAWVDTVTTETRRKVELLLEEAHSGAVTRRREVNHTGAGGAAIPVSWAAVRLGVHGPVLAVGRDLRAVAAIQQRFLDAQQQLERDYWQRREAESRYRLLFQVAGDAVLVLDAETLAVLEANPTAAAMFDDDVQPLPGSLLRERIDTGSRAVLDQLLLSARATGRAAEVRARLASSGAAIDVSATPFRAADRTCLLLRARSADAAAASPAPDGFFQQMPDAAVITDPSGRVRMANAAFVKLCQAPDEQRLRGRPIADALGDTQHQWPVLLAQVRATGLVGRARVWLQLPGALPLLAEVSAGLLADDEQEGIGFTLRPLAEPASAEPGPVQSLSAGLDALVARLGEQTLPELLVQARSLAERHLIDAALTRAGGSLDGAAQLLAIPVASLMARMHTLGLAPRPWLN